MALPSSRDLAPAPKQAVVRLEDEAEDEEVLFDDSFGSQNDTVEDKAKKWSPPTPLGRRPPMVEALDLPEPASARQEHVSVLADARDKTDVRLSSRRLNLPRKRNLASLFRP